MGEAKRNRERLGPWYGGPVVPGHPDWKEPAKKPKPEGLPWAHAGGFATPRSTTVDVTTADVAEKTTAALADDARNERRTAVLGAEAGVAPTVPEEPKPPEPAPRVATIGGPGMRRPVRGLGLLGAVALLATVAAGVDLGRPPEPRKGRR